jgi:hypothetical protein
MAKRSKERSAKRRTAKGRAAKGRATKARAAKASQAGFTVRLGPAINAVRRAAESIASRRTRAANTRDVDDYLDAARAFLDTWSCQDKVMTRTFK